MIGALPPERTIAFWHQIHELRPVMLATYGPTLGAIAALVPLCLATGFEAYYFTRDPTETLKVPFYIGLFSNIGILVWAATAAVCLFAATLLHRAPGSSEKRLFLLASGLLTAWLALDDLLTLHEVVIPTYLNVPQKVVLALFSSAVLSYLVRFRLVILETDYVLLILAVCFLGLSVLTDGIQGRIALTYHHYFEDGAKLMGIVGWAVYLTRTAIQQVLSIARL